MNLALGFSILLHLSMVTLFRIVIYFPRADVEYMNVSIVRADFIPGRLTLGRLNLPSPSDPFERLAVLSGDEPDTGASLWSDLPPIQLPKIRFDELDRLRLKMQGLKVGKRYDTRFGRGSSDLWARFGRGVGSISDALSSVMRAEQKETDPEPIRLSNPAPGFYAYIEWSAPPYRREVLGVTKIEALWGLEPASLSEAIAFPFRVDPKGNVLQVLRPLEGDPEIIRGAMKALRTYRFETIGEASGTQNGTLVIGGKAGAP